MSFIKFEDSNAVLQSPGKTPDSKEIDLQNKDLDKTTPTSDDFFTRQQNLLTFFASIKATGNTVLKGNQASIRRKD